MISTKLDQSKRVSNNREIEEEIISDKEVDEPQNNNARRFTDSDGYAASTSLGVDPSVDSLALEEYDYIESVEKSFD